MSACCAPSSDAGGRATAPATVVPAPLRHGSSIGPTQPVPIPAGRFHMGSADRRAYAGDGEGPVHAVELAAFVIDAVTVSNERFGAFIAATDHRTMAEACGWSFVFAGLLPDDFPPTRAVAA